MRLKDEKGYSLVEVLIVVAILAVVGGMICSIILSSTQLFSRSKDEVDVQSEAQTTINWLNDMLAEAGYGVTYTEDANLHTLEVFNESNIYVILYEVAEKKLYCEEQQFQADVSDPNAARLVVTSKQLLAEYVTEFNVDVSTLSDDNPVATITLGMKKGERSVNLVRNVTLRNGVMVNMEAKEVYAGKINIVSCVEDVVVYPMESFHAKGSDVQFTARVTGIGFPSQMVTWSIADRTGLQDGTVIDEHTGVLHIDENETKSSFVVKATSVDTDADGNRVSSTGTSGIVKIMTIHSVQIVNPPTTAQAVGKTLQLTALVHGENMDEMGSAVSWSIPDEYKREGLSVNSEGLVSLGLGLYNAFPTETDKASATVLVRATSVADPTKYEECIINLSFPDIDVDLDNLTYLVNRNGYVNLEDKLETIGMTSEDYKLVWNLTDDAGLGSKVSIDTATGIVSAVKDIDYTKEYSLTVKATAIMSGTQEVAFTQNITVVIPKVSISVGTEQLSIVKGNSGRMEFTVNGLNVSGTEVQVTSVPAVRNTLLYIQDKELVVSVGKDVTSEQFDVKLSLTGYSDISKTSTILVADGETSDDELLSIINVEDVYLHVPVPGEEGRAPSVNEIKLETTTRNFNGYLVTYTYDWTRSRVNIQIGSDTTVYFYKQVSGTDIVWYRANVEAEDFYVPTPTDGDFPAFSGDTATLAYAGDTYTYRKYTYGSDSYYCVKSTETGKWYYYDGTSKIWYVSDTVKERASGVATATASSQYDDNAAPIKAVDGVHDTRWASKYVDDVWIQVDLGNVYVLDCIVIDWEAACSTDYTVSISADGSTWYSKTITDAEKVYFRQDMGSSHYCDTLVSAEFGTGNMHVRYIKIEGTGQALGTYGHSIWEIYVEAGGLQP